LCCENRILKIGIIGKGNFSKKVLEYTHQNTEFEIIASLDSIVLEQVLSCETLDKLLSMVDGILILDPIYCDIHTLQTIVKYGKHAYIESPGLISYADFEKILQLSRESESVVQIGLKERFYNVFNDLEKYQVHPRIIDSHRYVKFSKQSKHLSVIDDLMLHDISLVIELVKSEIKSIQSTAVGLQSNQPDVVNTRMEFYNGSIATLSVSKIANKNRHDTKFFAESFYGSINFLEKYLKVQYNQGRDELNEVWGISTIYSLVKDSDEYISILGNELISFYHCIRNGIDVKAGISDYLQTIRISDKIKLQLERNYISKS